MAQPARRERTRQAHPPHRRSRHSPEEGVGANPTPSSVLPPYADCAVAQFNALNLKMPAGRDICVFLPDTVTPLSAECFNRDPQGVPLRVELSATNRGAIQPSSLSRCGLRSIAQPPPPKLN